MGEALVSCGVASGSTLLLGLVRALEEKKAGSTDDHAAGGLKTATHTEGSLTQTITEEVPEGASPPSTDPWWTSSRLSGPQGGYRGPHPLQLSSQAAPAGE